MPESTTVNVHEVLGSLEFLAGRRPDSPPADLERAFATLTAYRDGGVFVGRYAGDSAWERHAQGDEIVFVLDGETTVFLLNGLDEEHHRLRGGDLLVVPRGTWHRFETPAGVTIMTVTPQPTEHSLERPAAG